MERTQAISPRNFWLEFFDLIDIGKFVIISRHLRTLSAFVTRYLDQLKTEGYEFSEDDVKHLSPARSDYINVYGRYYFNIEEGLKRQGLRELRKPEEEFSRPIA